MSKAQYLAAKQRWAEKQKAAGITKLSVPVSERLPPGQRLTHDFPVLDLGIQPHVPLDQWQLSLTGLVNKPMILNWQQFMAMPQVEDVSDFHCVTTWSKFDCRWRGVPFTAIYEICEPKPEVQHVMFTSYDGYSTNVPLKTCLDDDVLLAFQFDGEIVAREHGGPVRVIIPKLYAWKGAKFVKGIEFMEKDQLGFWEVRGYSNTADPWTEDRFA